MKKSFTISITLLLLIVVCPSLLVWASNSFNQNSFKGDPFKEKQLRFWRVKEAQRDKDYNLRKRFEARGLNYPPEEIYIRAFKKEGIVELWVKDWLGQFVKYKDYTICASAGRLGPKRRQGDHQVPEGFYEISKFNPQSDYFLSLGINYPNKSDRLQSNYRALGGSIYIHGECKTVGCMPVNNEKIKELYWLAVLARDNGQATIPVHIFPFKFNNMIFYNEEMPKYANQPNIISFWDNIKGVYDYFEMNRRLPIIGVRQDGYYTYQ